MDPKTATLRLLDETFGRADAPELRVRLWDGTLWPHARETPATLVLRSPSALRAMMMPGTELGLARAYLADAFDIEGDIVAALSHAHSLKATLARQKVALAARLARLPRPLRAPSGRRARLRGRRHSLARDRAAVRHHYDVSNEFFRLVLGPTMVYSCAYYERPDATLDHAQTAKLDLVCRKLRLRPEQRFLDVGCGWGSLLLHAAKEYGVDATGVTLSERQAELAQRRIKDAGLEDRARVLVADYRELPEAERFDAIASVGMFEHVGAALLPAYFAKAMRLLAPRGAFLNHGIASVGPRRSPARGSFIATYVFPDGELVPIERSLAAAAGAGFEIRDVESLREHYARTLRAWLANLDASREEARKRVDEETFRVWRLYMASSAATFAEGNINVYQTLLSKKDEKGDSGLPLTRRDWYR